MLKLSNIVTMTMVGAGFIALVDDVRNYDSGAPTSGEVEAIQYACAATRRDCAAVFAQAHKHQPWGEACSAALKQVPPEGLEFLLSRPAAREVARSCSGAARLARQEALAHNQSRISR